MYLKPTSTYTIPSYRAFQDDQSSQQLVVNFHDFPVIQNFRKMAFLFSHACGFSKEVLHPVMQRLINHLRSLKEYDNTYITFVSWDDRNHGESGRLNKDGFSEHYRMSENGLDARQVIEAFNLNTSKYDQFIGVGHSLGACGVLLCEYYYPGSFDGVCVLEPIFTRTMHDREYLNKLPVMSARKRKYEWKDREECCTNLMQNRLFKTFHPEATELYLKYGFYETTEGTVKLICPGEIEHITYMSGIYSSFQSLKSLQGLNIPAHVVLTEDSVFSVPSYGRYPGDIANKMVTVDVVSGSHMLPLENVDIITPFIMKVVNSVNETQGKTFLEGKL